MSSSSSPNSSGSPYHWTDNLLEDPYETERKEEKRHHKLVLKRLAENERKTFISDAQYGIPTRCPCGGSIKHDFAPNPKYKRDFDTIPGLRYFTCEKYKDDGFHFRQPWVFGVEEEIRMLKTKTEEQNKTIEEMRKEIQTLTEEIAKIQQFI